MRDCHIHSNYTNKSNDSLESYAAAARAKNVEELTVVEPVEIIDGAVPFAFAFYKLSVKRSGEKLGFKFNLGLELGLQPDIESQIARVATSPGLDYVVASTNYVDKQDITRFDYFDGKKKEDVYKKYFEHVLSNVSDLNKYFDAYCKLDQIIKLGGDERLDYDKYGDILDAILEVLVNNDKGLEVYTGINYNGILPSPYPTILRRYKELGGKIITLGSGATKSKDLTNNFDYALDIIESVGFDEIATYHRREPEFEKIKSLRR